MSPYLLNQLAALVLGLAGVGAAEAPTGNDLLFDLPPQPQLLLHLLATDVHVYSGGRLGGGGESKARLPPQRLTSRRRCRTGWSGKSCVE